jgi:hypothetical protein
MLSLYTIYDDHYWYIIVYNLIMLSIPEAEVDILQVDVEGNCLLPGNCLHLQ